MHALSRVGMATAVLWMSACFASDDVVDGGAADTGDAAAQRDLDATVTGDPAGPVRTEPPPACAIDDDAGLADTDAGVDVALGTGDLTVLLVFDKSTSMDLQWDDRTRWHAASDAMLGAMQPYVSNLTMGAVMFPQIELCMVAPIEDAVQLDYQPGAQFIESWLQRVCHPHDPWGTPLQLALQHADAALDRAEALGLLEDRFRVLVVTDGEPTCEDDPAVIADYPRRWLERGVDTHVIGLPGSETATMLLDSIAEAGGTGTHQSPGTPEQLADYLALVLE